MKELTTVWEGAAEVGEGPVWDGARQVLWFVDIKAPALHQFDPQIGVVRSWPAPSPIGWAFPAVDGQVIVGLQQGLAHFDPASGTFNLVLEVEGHHPSSRLNDATVSADGSIWFCTMDDHASLEIGRYYRWNGQVIEQLPIPAIVMTNGPALSPDGACLYYVDTMGRTIYRADLGGGAQITARSAIVQIAAADGYPDGCTVDANGNLWVCLWGGWAAHLYSPAGDLMRIVEFPVANVTKIALGGADLKTAYATTARATLTPEQLDEQPLAGSVFAFEVEVPGLSVPAVPLLHLGSER